MRIFGFRLALLAVAAAAAHGCSPLPAEARQEAGAAAAALHPDSGLEVVPLAITSNGKVHRFRVEVARTGAEQAKGLMFRTAMGADEGMIFPMEPPRQASFWMKNTVIPLDLVFIAPGGTVESVASNAVPYSLDPIPSRGAVAAVLELNAGRTAELGIGEGDRVSWPLAPARGAP